MTNKSFFFFHVSLLGAKRNKKNNLSGLFPVCDETLLWQVLCLLRAFKKKRKWIYRVGRRGFSEILVSSVLFVQPYTVSLKKKRKERKWNYSKMSEAFLFLLLYLCTLFCGDTNFLEINQTYLKRSVCVSCEYGTFSPFIVLLTVLEEVVGLFSESEKYQNVKVRYWSC